MATVPSTAIESQPETQTASSQHLKALITGASSGIGEEFARQLADKGYRLILIARRADRLHQLASQLNAEVEVVVADLATDEGMAKVEAAINDHSPDLLVNNAGFGTTGKFHHVEPYKIADMITVHGMATAILSRAALPAMIDRGSGAIINVASIAAFIARPGSANYSATKAYMVALSRSLNAELRGTGVHVQALCPGFTYTEFHDTPEFERFSRDQVPRPLWMTASRVVQISIEALSTKKEIVIPGWRNKIIAFVASNRTVGPILTNFILGRKKR